MINTLFRMFGGFAIGIFAFNAIDLAFKHYSWAGLGFLPLIIIICAISFIFVLCFPYYLEDRKALRDWEKKKEVDRE